MASTLPPTSGPSARAPRLLLVDDDPIVLRAIRRLLVGWRPGWAIDIADSAEAAFQLLETKTYDVAVTDLHMPVQDGLELLRRLKAEHPTLIRVIHSSHVESLAPDQVQDLAHAVLAKPGRADELVAVLEWAIAERGRRVRDSVGF
ncbi:MAG: response regulator [Myxococcales bacterium]|nr:MAG: response regulator [Myxococcales bacterium]